MWKQRISQTELILHSNHDFSLNNIIKPKQLDFGYYLEICIFIYKQT